MQYAFWIFLHKNAYLRQKLALSRQVLSRVYTFWMYIYIFNNTYYASHPYCKNIFIPYNIIKYNNYKENDYVRPQRL